MNSFILVLSVVLSAADVSVERICALLVTRQRALFRCPSHPWWFEGRVSSTAVSEPLLLLELLLTEEPGIHCPICPPLPPAFLSILTITHSAHWPLPVRKDTSLSEASCALSCVLQPLQWQPPSHRLVSLEEISVCRLRREVCPPRCGWASPNLWRALA